MPEITAPMFQNLTNQRLIEMVKAMPVITAPMFQTRTNQTVMAMVKAMPVITALLTVILYRKILMLTV